MRVERLGVVAAGVVGVALVVSGCSSADNGHDMSAMTTSTSTPASTSAGDAPAQAHNDADVAFAQGMIPHHRQAIEMADVVLAKQDIDPRVVTLANAIKAAQGPEIDQMQGWLNDWGVSAPPSDGAMPGMPGHDMGTTGEGMMTEQDMTALRDAQGAEASKLFLTQMIEHHNGAITMAQTEIDTGQFPAAVALARSIVTAQQQEIATMRDIADSL
ncbi:DUF305 domain-containing protein [Mycolicibacterium goodii]|uniref:DUF305 domain-containing protein n=1 Tax=Mycolicibacterium goodii TaxID=134601 RepID=A0ABS6HLH4_MYCGD|nr:DUF305 domain-containing protein [Mycolicibacterium goodii]MBU8822775.1 DUF305 domain-containing protein [Mycolicibacterium goodii]MBU8838869.1 DUF305 domain-containing protein [Mycolicibacterium goodii]